MLQEINVSAAISPPCYHEFGICPFCCFSDDLIALQGTKVLEDREVRKPFITVANDAPQRLTFQRVIKYTGTRRSPEWMDLEQGSAFAFNRFVKGTHGKNRQI